MTLKTANTDATGTTLSGTLIGVAPSSVTVSVTT